MLEISHPYDAAPLGATAGNTHPMGDETMSKTLIHTIRIHTGTDMHGRALVTVVSGPGREHVIAEAQAIPGIVYEVEEWYSETRCKSRSTVQTLA